MQYIYCAISANRNLIKIGTTNNLADRQTRFNREPWHRGLEIVASVPLATDGRAHQWAVESLLRHDLAQQFAVVHTTVDTFRYNASTFNARQYAKELALRVHNAEQIIRKPLI